MGQKAKVSHLEVSYSKTCSRQGCIATTDTTQPAVYAKQSKHNKASQLTLLTIQQLQVQVDVRRP